MTQHARSELGRTTLSVLFIGGLIAGSLWMLAPFLGGLHLGDDDRRGDLADAAPARACFGDVGRPPSP